VCRELRKGGGDTPIILLTARTQEAEKVLGLQLGADDYVTKPFSPMELRARIQAVLRRAARGVAKGEVYRFGDMEVDFTRGELRKDGSVVVITPVEFRLLSTFIAHRGRLLSRQQLLDLVWTDASCVDRVVDTHVSNLRKKVEPDLAQPRYVVSVRGMGYRFEG
jgi:DNA-binding response OmpR family regulator